MKFEDLKFTLREMGGIGCHTEINGYTLSVQAGRMNYCSPRMDLERESEYISFEIAIWDSENPNKPWRTQDFVNVNDDVAGYMSRTEIEEVMSKLEASNR
jgi:hypothetical protein